MPIKRSYNTHGLALVSAVYRYRRCLSARRSSLREFVPAATWIYRPIGGDVYQYSAK